MSEQATPHDPAGPSPATAYRAADSDRLIAWVREAADELEKAHRVLDDAGVPRIREESGNAMTLAARIVTLDDMNGRPS